tara:strand:+ start:1045 stop:1233 length:189 start_codon:yes stop_codon:yes gene_type:complete
MLEMMTIQVLEDDGRILREDRTPVTEEMVATEAEIAAMTVFVAAGYPAFAASAMVQGTGGLQ